MNIKCPNCGVVIPVKMPGNYTSEKKAIACRENGKKGGRPRIRPRLLNIKGRAQG